MMNGMERPLAWSLILALASAAAAGEGRESVPKANQPAVTETGIIERVIVADLPPSRLTGCDILFRAEPGGPKWLSVGNRTRVVRDNPDAAGPMATPASWRDLRAGQTVRVTHDGAPLESYPPRGRAFEVVIETVVAAEPSGHGPAARRERLDLKEAPLADALAALEAKFGIRYTALDEALDGAAPVTLEGEFTLQEALAEIARQAGVSATTGTDGVVSIGLAKPPEPAPGGPVTPERAAAVLQQHYDRIRAIPGVHGTGSGYPGHYAPGHERELGIQIDVPDEDAAARVRAAIENPLDGVPVHIRVMPMRRPMNEK